MLVARTVCELKDALLQTKNSLGGKLGFVPTMGAIHGGHLSLISRSKNECQRTVVSVFVNEAQFAKNEDFDSYPRDHKRDLYLIKNSGCDLVFMPALGEIYKKDQVYSKDNDLLCEKDDDLRIFVGEIGDNFEGAYRKNHFQGVATVVAKLFNLVRPDSAYFGRKDAQQLSVIKKLNDKLFFGVNIVACDTLREKDGLAMSSRNTYLSTKERAAAAVIYRGLVKGKEGFYLGKENPKELTEMVELEIKKEPLAKMQYVALVEADSFTTPKVADQNCCIVAAVHIGSTRLIDCIFLSQKG